MRIKHNCMIAYCWGGKWGREGKRSLNKDNNCHKLCYQVLKITLRVINT